MWVHEELHLLPTLGKVTDPPPLQDFYEELSREEMYMRYIFKLFHLHKEQKNFVEAAFTLDLYAKKLLVNSILTFSRALILLSKQQSQKNLL